MVFVRDPILVSPLRARVQQWLGSPDAMAEVSLLHPEGFSASALERTFESVGRHGVRLCWLEAHRGDGIQRWDQERVELLSRLNERRGSLEATLKGPMILLLPEDGLREAASFAPDLWHVRSLTVTLALDGLRPQHHVRASDLHPFIVHTILYERVATPPTSSWLERWRMAMSSRHAEGMDLSDPAILDLQVFDGAVHVREALAAGQVAMAQATAEALVRLASARSASGDHGQSIGALWELTFAYLARADVHLVRRQAPMAIADYDSAVDVATSLRAQDPNNALNQVLGATAKDAQWFALATLDDWGRAEAVLRDLLDQRRRGFAPGGFIELMSIAMTLMAWGHVRAVRGSLSDALCAFDEAHESALKALDDQVDTHRARLLLGLSSLGLAQIHLLQGDLALALPKMADAIEQIRSAAALGIWEHDAQANWVTYTLSTARFLHQAHLRSADEAVQLAVQLSARLVEQEQRSPRALLLRWRCLTMAKTVSPTPEIEQEMSGLKMEWSARFPELPASPDQADFLSSGVPVPALPHPSTGLSDS
ncbi:hypothetical protein OU995_15755 [Roseateles sp. SL47]|uniref:hypothetical protein n=1 Tax=Roseateles sp. SL47 TaxID=2995138 RepID=UPI00227026DA|nr:hypothetical protein [Roseateles sp. SL47]WAC71054.1 hypothetical protein OU995_15755 [Roseateles sp. SL47]